VGGVSTAPSSEQVGRTQVRVDGRTLTFFGGCDYFRLASDLRVVAAFEEGIRRHGLSVAASRVTTGDHPLYGEVEAALSASLGVEATLLTGTGYLAVLTVAETLAADTTHAFLDERAHAALQDAARLLGCPAASFAHRDPAGLAKLLAALPAGSRPVVLTDGVFSFDGSVAPLRAYRDALPDDGLIVVDDAHGVGVVGATGRGAVELEGVDEPRVVRCLSLAKAPGVFGGAIAGTEALRTRIVRESRSFAGSTPIPLPTANAALTSVGILASAQEPRTRLQANAAFVRGGLRAAGIEVPDVPAPIVAVRLHEPGAVERVQRALLDADVLPPSTGYPDASGSTLRFVISSEHTRAELETLVRVLAG